MADDRPTTGDFESLLTPLRVIAVLMVIGAAYAAAQLLVPFALAFILAVALSPAANWLERHGMPRVLAGLTCTLGVAAAIGLAVGLLSYQAGTIVKNSDGYVHRFGSLIDRGLERTHSEHAADTFGIKKEGKGEAGGEARADASAEPTDGPPGRGEDFLRRSLRSLGRWLMSGVGGLLGAVGGAVVFLAFLFYMLQGREGWTAGAMEAMRRMGLRPSPEQFTKVRGEVMHYLKVLAMVSAAYVVVVSLVLWLIGVPQPFLWGVMAGIFEAVPYFGPLIASVFPIVVSLSLGTWWQPAAVAAMYLSLHLVEGYVISPVLYGRAVRLDPVTILLGALFFGGLWGPVGLAIATPMMIVLRGLLVITPDTPALDALADVKDEKADAARDAAGTTRHPA